MNQIMVPNVLISTGWCAQNEGHNNPLRSKLQNESTYLGSVWLPYILKQIEPGAINIYVSKCDTPPATGLLRCNNLNVVWSHRDARKLAYRHDWSASIISGAAYAMANDMDLLYVEQDCLAYGLADIVRYAQTSSPAMMYGFGDNASWAPGWAENSLTFVSSKLLPPFIWAMNEIRNCTDGDVKFEHAFHNVLMAGELSEYFHPWPFGCGRKRPVPFDQENFYAQQLTDEDLDGFLTKLYKSNE